MKSLLKPYRNECILILVILTAAAAMLAWQSFHRKPAAIAQVTVDGHVVKTLDLNQDGEYTIESAQGGSNHLIIQDGKIWCDQATCPDKVCVHQGKRYLDGGTIVCLPNKMVVQVIRE